MDLKFINGEYRVPCSANIESGLLYGLSECYNSVSPVEIESWFSYFEYGGESSKIDKFFGGNNKLSDYYKEKLKGSCKGIYLRSDKKIYMVFYCSQYEAPSLLLDKYWLEKIEQYKPYLKNRKRFILIQDYKFGKSFEVDIDDAIYSFDSMAEAESFVVQRIHSDAIELKELSNRSWYLIDKLESKAYFCYGFAMYQMSKLECSHFIKICKNRKIDIAKDDFSPRLANVNTDVIKIEPYYTYQFYGYVPKLD